MQLYFEWKSDPDDAFYFDETKKFEIYSKHEKYYAEQIEEPCNDRRLLCRGDSVGEVVEWIINNL